MTKQTASRLKYLYLITTFLYLSISSCFSSVEAVERGGQTEITANIPAAVVIRVFGYTAPNALVQAEGYRVFAQVSSDKNGYFLIDPLPISDQAKEICLSTIDSERKTGFPLCISVPSASDTALEIGPILLSPTIGLSSDSIWQKQTVAAAGYTVPNSKVVFSFFEVAKVSTAQQFTNVLAKIFHPEVEAASLPFLAATSDKKGAFSINLPTGKAKGYRVFVKALYRESPGPKSHTLSYMVGSSWEYWRKYILPKLIFVFAISALSSWLIVWEIRTKKLRSWFAYFSEKRLLPFEVRTGLRLRRLWYNLRELWMSNRK